MLKSVQNRVKMQFSREDQGAADNRMFGVPWIIILVQFIIIVTLLLSIFAYFLTRPIAEKEVVLSTKTFENFDLQTSQYPLTLRRRYKTTSAVPQSIDIDFSEDAKPLEQSTNQPAIKATTQRSVYSELLESHEEDTIFESDHLRAAVFSESQVCSDIGKSMLIRGGNAVDAAISVSFCMMAALPQKASLAGGVNLLIRETTGKIITINGRESTPIKANQEELLRDPSASRRGPKSSATPGALNGLFRAFQQFSSHRLSFKQLALPTIQLCIKGINASEELKNDLKSSNISNILSENGTIYCNSLAATLTEIVEFENPLESFYGGEIARRLTTELNGYVDPTDLEDYESDISPAICSDIDVETRLCGPGPPSLFAILANSYLVSKNMSNLEKVNEVAMISASFANKIGDPMFSKSSKSIAEELANGIRKKADEKSKQKHAAQNVDFTENGSTGIFIIDEKNMTVSLTLSLGDLFGSHVYSSSGFFWNNKLRYFDLQSSNQALSLQPGKVPTTLISPFVVLRNNSVLAVGGGTDLIGMLHLLRDITHRNYDSSKISPALFMPNFASGIILKSNKQHLHRYSVTGY